MPSTVSIRGVNVKFPYEPYSIQKEYMEKVIECLQGETNGILESPTGTGKTLSLLCSSLAWLESQKKELKSQYYPSLGAALGIENDEHSQMQLPADNQDENLDFKGFKIGRNFVGMPTIIYASRTHSQLSQAMQELKKTEYRHMKAIIIGSREQMCIDEEVCKQDGNSAQVCTFNNTC